MYCKNCGSKMDDIAVICVKCGAPKGQGFKYCMECGKEYAGDHIFKTTGIQIKPHQKTITGTNFTHFSIFAGPR